MKHDLAKMLFDRNPDESVTYDREDWEIITREYNENQSKLKELIGTAYDELLNNVKSRMDGIANFADGNEEEAVSFHLDSKHDFTNPVQNFLQLSISLWGEKLNDVQTLYAKDEQVGEWICSISTSHRFAFTMPITKKLA